MCAININSLYSHAKRPRILLIDFEESDARFLSDIGYKVYLGATGLQSEYLYIPIENHRVDILIYRCAYDASDLSKGEKKKSILTTFCKYPDQDNPSCRSPQVHPDSKCSEEELFFMRDYVLQKGGTIIGFLGTTRLSSDEELFKNLMKISGHYQTVTRDGGEDGEYELEFRKEYSLREIQRYFEKILIGDKKYKMEALRGVPSSAFSVESNVLRTVAAYDESQYFYAFFQGEIRGGSNICFLPDFGSSNILVINEMLPLLKKSSPKEIFQSHNDKSLI